VIVQTQDQWITANFKETQLKKMGVGQQVNITVDALSRKFTGTVQTCRRPPAIATVSYRLKMLPGTI
jgi:multidrug resistance efflux pump